MQKQTQQLALMLVIGVLIGTMGVLVWKTNGIPGKNSANTTPDGAATEKTIATSTASLDRSSNLLPAAPEIPKNSRVGISVSDQPAGSSVDVTGLSLTENHWVAVYEDKDGRPGWILGASRAHAGEPALSVSLLRPTTAGGVYYAAILNDDGDDTFNRQTDLPPLSPNQVVIVSFLAK